MTTKGVPRITYTECIIVAVIVGILYFTYAVKRDIQRTCEARGMVAVPGTGRIVCVRGEAP